MKKTVTEEQIQRLYQFTRQHYVEHYDLQTELVDHLANAIETHWEQTPDLDFEDCIKDEFQKFGIFGFMDVVEKRQKALKKKYRKLIWHEVVDFFQLPKILLTGGLTFLLFFAMQSVAIPRMFYVIFYILMLLFVLTNLAVLQYKYRKRIEKTGRKWVLEESIFKVASFPAMGNLLSQFYLQSFIQKWTVENPYVVFLLCLEAVVFFVFTYVAVFYLPKNAEKYLQETYPEYNLV